MPCNLFSTEDFVSSIAETWDDIADVIEFFINGSNVYIYVRVLGFKLGDALWGCHEKQAADVFAARVFQKFDGCHERAASGEHGIKDDSHALFNVLGELHIIFHWLQGFLVAVETDNRGFSAGNHVKHTVHHTQSCTQDWDDGDHFTFNTLHFHFSSPALNGGRFGGEVFGGLISQQTRNFGCQRSKAAGGDVIFSEQTNLMLDQRVVYEVYGHVILSFQVVTIFPLRHKLTSSNGQIGAWSTPFCPLWTHNVQLIFSGGTKAVLFRAVWGYSRLMSTEKNILDKQQWERRVESSDAGMRLDAYWAKELESEGVSRGKVQEWIKAGNASVDIHIVKKPKCKIVTGAVLVLTGQVADCSAMPEEGPLDIVYEDDDLAVLDKEAGLTTHPAPSQPAGTLVNRLVARYPEICDMDALRPGIVHRLDKDTSGIMVVARREKTRLALASDFASRKVDKLYLALAHGVPANTEFDIELPLGRDPRIKTKMAVVEKGGRAAKTKVKVLWHDRDRRMSFLAVRILTGRTHQVRVHLASMEHPLLGDVTYGSSRHVEWQRETGLAADLCVRQMLHAFKLSFDHPETGERMAFAQRPPEDFMTLLEACNERCMRVGITGAPGSGKSAFSEVLQDLGAPVFSADTVVAELYRAGGDGADMIASRYGGRYNGADGEVDKPALMAAMQGSEALRREIMDMIHPMVRHRMDEFFLGNATSKVAFAEIPLLMETGWSTGEDDGVLDLTVGVDCPEELRTGVRREARGMSVEMLALLDSWQWPAEKKLAACDVVIDNSGDEAALKAQAELLLQDAHAMGTDRATEFKAYVDDLLETLS